MVFLVLSIKPCSDGTNAEDHQKDEISANHNHQEDSNDSCPATCICNCCGMSITYEPLATFVFRDCYRISTEVFYSYQSKYRFDFLTNIWQPPQVII